MLHYLSRNKGLRLRRRVLAEWNEAQASESSVRSAGCESFAVSNLRDAVGHRTETLSTGPTVVCRRDRASKTDS